MGKFNAGTAVEVLEYDFTDYVPDCKGSIPEPSTEQLDAYFNAIRDLAKNVQNLRAKAERAEHAEDNELSNDEVDAILAEMDDLSISKYTGEMTVAIADLCSGQPSKEQIEALPFRVKQAFLQWVTGEFRPEAGAPTSRG